VKREQLAGILDGSCHLVIVRFIVILESIVLFINDPTVS